VPKAASEFFYGLQFFFSQLLHMITSHWTGEKSPEKYTCHGRFTEQLSANANKKLIFLKKFFCILLFEGTFTSFFKVKKSKRSHKTVEIKVFLTIFA
jgi:hypothetical protein